MSTGKAIDPDLVLQALGDATRRRMVEALGSGPLSVSALAEPLGVTLTAVSQHLRVLEEAGLASTQKIGRVRTCRLETAGLDALRLWIEDRRSLWDKRLDRLTALFDERS